MALNDWLAESRSYDERDVSTYYNQSIQWYCDFFYGSFRHELAHVYTNGLVKHAGTVVYQSAWLQLMWKYVQQRRSDAH